ncbi:N-acetyl-gamma-glutamyl-phosphate reductase [Kallotenue papyrolyticum]|uniref:N-acetyl-gamma-glutamyl-phosphate reductase n=1 Tax=Kallotenue papyrolyticum TaxID=1325125 RepID=UPI000470C676|nr:N-acetyl-gamma-glutamyl-phosphate reductase [Kallotenue papyrolyticum]
MIRVAIAGASGYVGGELLRLLLRHPAVQVTQATSERHAGQFVHATHPNLRGHTTLRYVPLAALEPCDVLILALPHGRAAQEIERYAQLAPRIIDCSADFRLRDAALYRRWYGAEHPNPAWLERFVYGLPELNRAAIRGARYVSGVGCNATAVNLALLPLARAGLIDTGRPIIAEVKVGSSEGGNQPSEASHHPERSHVVRSYAPVGHRHTAEVAQALGLEVHLSITAVELVRGALATCHVWLREPLSERELWRAYRAAYSDEPFVRIVHERSGIYRHPEPKLLAGSNYADVGWALDEGSGRVVALAALDNLQKGAAGSAVQCLNLMHDLPETLGLEFIGLHPV